MIIFRVKEHVARYCIKCLSRASRNSDSKLISNHCCFIAKEKFRKIRVRPKETKRTRRTTIISWERWLACIPLSRDCVSSCGATAGKKCPQYQPNNSRSMDGDAIIGRIDVQATITYLHEQVHQRASALMNMSYTEDRHVRVSRVLYAASNASTRTAAPSSWRNRATSSVVYNFIVPEPITINSF